MIPTLTFNFFAIWRFLGVLLLMLSLTSHDGEARNSRLPPKKHRDAWRVWHPKESIGSLESPQRAQDLSTFYQERLLIWVRRADGELFSIPLAFQCIKPQKKFPRALPPLPTSSTSSWTPSWQTPSPCQSKIFHQILKDLMKQISSFSHQKDWSLVYIPPFRLNASKPFKGFLCPKGLPLFSATQAAYETQEIFKRHYGKRSYEFLGFTQKMVNRQELQKDIERLQGISFPNETIGVGKNLKTQRLFIVKIPKRLRETHRDFLQRLTDKVRATQRFSILFYAPAFQAPKGSRHPFWFASTHPGAPKALCFLCPKCASESILTS